MGSVKDDRTPAPASRGPTLPSQTEVLDGIRNLSLQNAERLDARAGALQVAGVVASVVGVVVPEETWGYLLGVAGFVLILAWLYVWKRHRSLRDAGERARRAGLLAGGLGLQLTPEDLRDLVDAAAISLPEAAQFQQPDYYAAQSPPGKERLREMLEESAFWSSRLFEASATQTMTQFRWLLVAVVVIVLATVPLASREFTINEMKVVLILLGFLSSGEMLEKAWRYDVAAKSVRRIELRLQALREGGSRFERLLPLLMDYNSAVEAAPMMAPGVYRKHRERLDHLWKSAHPDSAA
jgi:hypothetical protein